MPGGSRGWRSWPTTRSSRTVTWPGQYVARFEPWCVFSILAAVVLWTRGRWRSLGREGIVLHGAAIFVIVMMATYTLVAAKRADYLAPACAPGAMLAAWWLVQGASWRRWQAMVWAPVILVVLTVYNATEPTAPFRGFGNTISAFIEDADRYIEADPAPVVCWQSGYTHMKSFLGYTGDTDQHGVDEMVESGRPFWLVLGRWAPGIPPLRRYGEIALTETCRSRLAPPSKHWPTEVMLYRAESIYTSESPTTE